MNKWACVVIVLVILFGLIYADVISTDMLLEWADIALTWLIEALTSLRGYLHTL